MNNVVIVLQKYKKNSYEINIKKVMEYLVES